MTTDRVYEVFEKYATDGWGANSVVLDYEGFSSALASLQPKPSESDEEMVERFAVQLGLVGSDKHGDPEAQTTLLSQMIAQVRADERERAAKELEKQKEIAALESRRAGMLSQYPRDGFQTDEQYSHFWAEVAGLDRRLNTIRAQGEKT